MRILDNIGLVQDPIHLGAVILDKLIGDLKSKLPFLSKKKGDDDDLDEEDDEGTETETEVSSGDDEKTSVARPSSKLEDDTSVDEEVPDNSLVAKLKAKISALQKKKPKDDLEAAIADEGDVPVKEKKKPNLIVIIGAVGLIAFIFLSDFGEEQAPVADPAAMLKKRPKKEKPATTETPAEKTPTETTPTDTATDTTTAEKPATEPTTTTEPSTTETPVDTTVTTPTETTPTDTTVTTEPTTTEPTTTTEPSTTETPVDTTVTTPTETTPTDSTVTTEPTTTEPTTTTPEDTTTTTTTTTTPTDNGSVDSVTGEDTKGADDNLTEQILKDLENQAQGTEKAKPTVKTEYVPPPNFENVGRGLVYNCTGKHWACIDGPSYKTCEDNASSTKFLTKKTECYPFNVYETQSGCEKMQNRMVSSGAKTQFCGE